MNTIGSKAAYQPITEPRRIRENFDERKPSAMGVRHHRFKPGMKRRLTADELYLTATEVGRFVDGPFPITHLHCALQGDRRPAFGVAMSARKVASPGYFEPNEFEPVRRFCA